MTTLRTAAQQALEAWDGGEIKWFKRAYTVMENLRSALAEPSDSTKPVVESETASEPVQEPVASAGLGPLPEPAQPAEPEGYMPGCLWPLPATPDYYTAEQMREYALRAQAEPQEPDSPERRCGGPGCDMKCCQPVQEPQGCDHCNHPLYAATKCRVCGRVTEPAQEPVAWRYWKDKFACWEYSDTRLEFPAVPAGTKMYPLYADPLQRKPLTEDEIDNIWDSEKAFADIYAITRAIERAHGIGGEE